MAIKRNLKEGHLRQEGVRMPGQNREVRYGHLSEFEGGFVTCKNTNVYFAYIYLEILPFKTYLGFVGISCIFFILEVAIVKNVTEPHSTHEHIQGCFIS